VEIRAARATDAADLSDLLGQLGYPTTPAQAAARLARMSAESGQHALVAEMDGRVVGLTTIIVRHVISADAPFARIASVVVAESHRSRGIGQSLVEAAERIAREAGCDRIEVTSGEHRARAHDFYRRLGYEERPRRFIKTLDLPLV
jgi:GNAT superfamily N-acetyltransferase